MAPFVHGGVPPLYIWDLFCCRCFQMLKLQPKFFLISIIWRVAFQVWGKRADENLCIYSFLGKLAWAAWISQIKVQNLNFLFFAISFPKFDSSYFCSGREVTGEIPLLPCQSVVSCHQQQWTLNQLQAGGFLQPACCVRDTCVWGPLPGHRRRVFPLTALLRTVKCVGEQLLVVAEGCN